MPPVYPRDRPLGGPRVGPGPAPGWPSPTLDRPLVAPDFGLPQDLPQVPGLARVLPQDPAQVRKVPRNDPPPGPPRARPGPGP